jgi:hypothetical protein
MTESDSSALYSQGSTSVISRWLDIDEGYTSRYGDGDELVKGSEILTCSGRELEGWGKSSDFFTPSFPRRFCPSCSGAIKKKSFLSLFSLLASRVKLSAPPLLYMY